MPKNISRQNSIRILFIKVNERIGQLHAKNIQPPVGLLYLAAVLKPLGYDIRVLDMMFDAPTPAALLEEVKRFQPCLIGLSSMSLNVGLFERCIEILHKHFPEIPIIAGGPHPTAFPDDCLQIEGLSAIVIGEGEETITELIPALLENLDLSAIKGIGWRRNGKIIISEPRPFANIESLPYPDWACINFRRYWNYPSMTVKGAHPYFPLLSSRGCPYQCIYCHKIFGKKFRARSAENLFSEVMSYHEQYGVRDFEFIDDIFNLDRQRVHDFCKRIIESRKTFSFSLCNGVRGDILDEETIKLLAQAGFDVISFAVETASPRLQELIKKRNKLDKLVENMALAHKYGIFNYGFFMLGFPTETREEMEQTIELAMTVEADVISFFKVIPFKSTELWQYVPEVVKQNPQIFERAGYVLNLKEFNLSEVPIDQIDSMQRQAMKRFYLNPRRILRIFWKNPRRRGLLNYFRFYVQNLFFPKSLNSKSVWY